MIEILLNIPDPQKSYATNVGRYKYRLKNPNLQMFDRMPIRSIDNTKMPDDKGMYPFNIVTENNM
ncbi:MAG: hypothetical protein ACREAU_00805 [Nitrosopumilaceae archaeon]